MFGNKQLWSKKITSVIKLPARAGERILTWTFIIGILFFQIDASFQNGEEYAVGEEEMYKEKEMLWMG